MAQPIRNISELVALTTNYGISDPGWGGRFHFFKDARRVTDSYAASSTGVANQWTSLWEFCGQPCHGDPPGTTASIPNNATNGAMPFPDIIGDSMWLVGVGATGTFTTGRTLIYDRVWHCGGYDATSTSNHDVSGDPTPDRLLTAEDCANTELFIEIYTQVGATARTLTVGITDPDTNDYNLSATIGGTGAREAQRLIHVPWRASGATGIQNVREFALSASTGTAGSYGLTLMRRLAEVDSTFATWSLKSLTRGPRPQVQVYPNSCIAMAHRPNQANQIHVIGHVAFVEQIS